VIKLPLNSQSALHQFGTWNQCACSDLYGYYKVTSLTRHQHVKHFISFMSTRTRSPSFSQCCGLPARGKQELQNQMCGSGAHGTARTISNGGQQQKIIADLRLRRLRILWHDVSRPEEFIANQRLGKHTTSITGNGIFYSVRPKWL
jgi:hypothetical protein